MQHEGDRSAPTVSVVIPCYNAESFLRETLDSVLKQSHPPLEVIVVDDGSTDQSSSIAESYGSPIRIIRQQNQGESVARNRGIDEAKGEWIAFLDADDVWRPSKLEKQLESVDDSVVAVHTNLFHFGESNHVTKIQEVPAAERYSIEYLATANPFATPSSILVRRSVSPRFPTWTRFAEDLIFCLELVRRGRIQFVEAALTGYRRHADSQSMKTLGVAVHWYQTVQTWLDKNPDLLSDDARTRVRDHWLSRIASAARRLKNRRHWAEYWKVRHFIEAHRGHPSVDLILQNRIYPPWVYAAYDMLRLVAKAPFHLQSRGRRTSV